MLVQINGLQSEVMEYLLTFLYTARTTITPSNVQMLLEAANLFQIDLLKRKCTDFMYKQLDPCNCLGMKVSFYRWKYRVSKREVMHFYMSQIQMI